MPTCQVKMKKGRFHCSVKVNENIYKGLKSLEPKCASKRISILTSETVEKAQDNILKTQQNYIAQRSRIRKQLNTPSSYVEEIFTLESNRNLPFSTNKICFPKKIPMKNLNLRQRSFTPIRKQANDYFEKNFEDVTLESWLERKAEDRKNSLQLPFVGKILDSNSGKVKRTISIVQDGYTTQKELYSSFRGLSSLRVKSLKL